MKIHFIWIEAHIRILGKELACKLAKHVAGQIGIGIVYYKTPNQLLKYKLKIEDCRNCRIYGTTQSIPPSIKERLKFKLPLIQRVIALVTGHGKSQIHLADDPTYSCKQENKLCLI